MESFMVNVFNIQHFSTNDGSGIRTVVFMKGCALDCVWCHNPESKAPQPQLAFYENLCAGCGRCKSVCSLGVHKFKNKVHFIDFDLCKACGKCADACVYAALEILGKQMSEDEVIEKISKDSVFYGKNGGVTFSGGEPFMQAEALIKLLKMCKARRFNTAVETSGFTRKENIIRAAEFTDTFLYDCKETDNARHIKYVGADMEKIFQNLCVLDKLRANVVLRCPVIPGINDRHEHFKNLAQTANMHSSVKRIELMAYHPLGIAKSRQTGRELLYLNSEFLKRETLDTYIKFIQKLTDKTVCTG